MIGDLVLIASLLLAFGLVVGAVLALAGHEARRAALSAVCLLALVAVYTGALATASATSRPVSLRKGEWKCFDEWCVTLATVTRVSDGRIRLSIETRNKGRRAQRPDRARAYVLVGGRSRPLTVPGLGSRLDGGDTRTVTAVVAARAEGRLLVTEGGFPSRIVIGDENSPGHARSSWPIG